MDDVIGQTVLAAVNLELGSGSLIFLQGQVQPATGPNPKPAFGIQEEATERIVAQAACSTGLTDVVVKQRFSVNHPDPGHPGKSPDPVIAKTVLMDALAAGIDDSRI